MSNEYTLYGIGASLYTGKARAYLRQHGIPFIEKTPGHPEYLGEIIPQIGRWIIPVLKCPDGALLQDGTDILDHFEKSDLKKYSIYPESGVLRCVSLLFELFGNEGLLRPAMHYRWNFDETNLAFLKSSFMDLFPAGREPEWLEQMFEFSSGRMRQATRAFGVTDENKPVVEESYRDFLTRFNTHLQNASFLLGNHPTIGDYGLLNPLFAHLSRDPYPTTLMKQVAPRVFKWVERMNGSEHHLDPHVTWQGKGLYEFDDVPDTLTSLMKYVAEDYLAEITAHVEFANAWLADRPELEESTNGLDDPGERAIGVATFDWRGFEIRSVVMPYRFYLLQRVQDCHDLADASDQEKIRALFCDTGLEPILDCRTTRRVERVNHLEVWGELRDARA